jgi:hypothetical protein
MLINFLLLFLPWGIAFRVFSLILFCAVLIGHFADQNLSGKVLDIGSGNGILSIELAQAIPGVEVKWDGGALLIHLSVPPHGVAAVTLSN